MSKLFTLGESLTLSFDALYRYQTELILDGEWNHGYQVMMVYAQDWEHFQLAGYVDWWNVEYLHWESQIWWKATKKVFFGFEVSLSNYELYQPHANYAMAGLKWDLE